MLRLIFLAGLLTASSPTRYFLLSTGTNLLSTAAVLTAVDCCSLPFVCFGQQRLGLTAVEPVEYEYLES